MRRLVIAALSALAVGAAMATALSAPSAACADGETGVTNGCAPFCPPGRYFDYAHTGLCLPDPPPPPSAVPIGSVPQSVSP